jgi:hypothetical protein
MLRSPEDVIARELRRGEKLLWAGQPRGGIRLRGTDAFVIPFSILWPAFAMINRARDVYDLILATKHGAK